VPARAGLTETLIAPPTDLDRSVPRRVLVADIDRALLGRCADVLPADRVSGAPELLEGIARTAATSPASASVPGTFVVRHGEHPALAVVGSLDEAAADRVASLFEHLDTTLTTLRYVDHRQAERDVAALAEALSTRLDQDWLQGAHLVGIPRGGLVVVGLLALTLGVPAARVGTWPDDPSVPVVVVDDAILTGHRLGEWLLAHRGGPRVVAALYAHPDARVTIEREAPDVVACVSARDLRDLGPERYGAHYEEWRESWRRDLDAPRYWIGAPEALAFAWKEPDHSLWNEFTGRREPGWRVLPRSLCLAPPSPPVGSGRVQIMPRPVGPWLPSPTAITAELDGELVVADPAVGEGAAWSLTGVAAEMWRTMVRHGRIGPAASALAERFATSRDEVAADLAALLPQLHERGLASAPRSASASG
jgi:hypothetical protein